MSWEVGHQICDNANGAYAGSAAAMRDAKRLVQIEVADVAAKLTGGGNADQGVHVGTIHIHASAMRMHQRAQLFHLRLEHAVGAGVSDHHAGQVGTVLFALGFQVGHVHIAIGVACGDHHSQARHVGAGRVGAMGAAGDQADVAMGLALGLEEGLDDQQPSVFTLRARIGLQADAGVARGLAQPGA